MKLRSAWNLFRRGDHILVNDAAFNKWIPFAQLQDLRIEE